MIRVNSFCKFSTCRGISNRLATRRASAASSGEQQERSEPSSSPAATPPSGGGGTSPPPSGDNQPPVAMINGPVSGFCNRAYLFDGTQSYDPEGQPLRYSWRIDPAGSGTIANATGAQTNITFSRSGANTITLIVNDQSQDSFPAIYTFTISNMMCR